MQRVAERANPYMYYVIETIEENDIPSELALLPIVESAFQPFAYSHGRAAGIWQFMPGTARRSAHMRRKQPSPVPGRLPIPSRNRA